MNKLFEIELTLKKNGDNYQIDSKQNNLSGYICLNTHNNNQFYGYIGKEDFQDEESINHVFGLFFEETSQLVFVETSNKKTNDNSLPILYCFKDIKTEGTFTISDNKNGFLTEKTGDTTISLVNVQNEENLKQVKSICKKFFKNPSKENLDLLKNIEDLIYFLT
jgi:hypothetical protein